MTVFFTKMIFRGRAFLLVDCTAAAPPDPCALARRLLCPRCGAGGDALALLLHGKEGFFVRCFRPDGSALSACEAGAVCAAAQLWRTGPADAPAVAVAAGERRIVVRVQACGRTVRAVSTAGENAPPRWERIAEALCGRADCPGPDLRCGRW